jgi:hypothetical protein
MSDRNEAAAIMEQARKVRLNESHNEHEGQL